jgi:bifunctional NMN adenylyltransferase/nudix hydrolase
MDTNVTKDLTVFIGRFSPFHLGHAEVLKRALHSSKAVLILIGSAGQARTTKNPFTYDERANLVRNFVIEYAASQGLRYNLAIEPLHDQPYNEAAWIREVQDAVDRTKLAMVDRIGLNPTVYLTGSNRDHSTYYLNTFGTFFKMDLITNKEALNMSATKVRDIYFGEERIPQADLLPGVTIEFLTDFMDTAEYGDLCNEYDFIASYKEAWKVAPHPVTFNTVDACVIQSGHVLVVVRDNFPGRGLWALPGGFLEQNERLVDGAVRELIEETQIELSKAQLYGSIKSKEIFDNPDRSLRGRTLTTGFLLRLDDTKPLPKTKPQKGEVQKVMWLPINEALNRTEKWFEDHHSILSTLYARL